MNKFLEAASDLLYLLYPEYCLSCNSEAPARLQLFCIPCLSKLPFSDHFSVREHELYLRFLGRQEIIFSAALFDMYMGGAVHRIIYNFKYHRKRQIGVLLGEYFGKRLETQNVASTIDFIIPVPIHKQRLRKRGFNQSLEFAKGIHKVLDIPILQNILIKQKSTSSQTKKGRRNRLDNVKDSFYLNTPETIREKHILLVDDIVTTGATLDACIMKIRESIDATFSIAIIALTKH